MTKKLTMWIAALVLGTFVLASCATQQGIKPGTKLTCPKCGAEIVVPGAGAP
ncbi:MAG: hypothetical protein HY730_03855 [Candidatus Tectomicrobia bacterium]|uniref:Lipoprotein n=1 Tax=Tectimicrobiota bacterium TaxID=2528274 RepID=A0A933GL93_UNCTE|nr:hypothetical protein [Candidatus Tectomicrobia bacterium]